MFEVLPRVECTQSIEVLGRTPKNPRMQIGNEKKGLNAVEEASAEDDAA